MYTTSVSAGGLEHAIQNEKNEEIKTLFSPPTAAAISTEMHLATEHIIQCIQLASIRIQLQVRVLHFCILSFEAD